MKKYLACLIATALFVGGCGKDSDNDNKNQPTTKPNPNRVNWEAVPAEFHPEIDEHTFSTNSADKINLDYFGFDRDVVVDYSGDLQPNQGKLMIYKVWKKSASWGQNNVRWDDGSVRLYQTGQYACSIRVVNGQITELEGGCYVRLVVTLPVGSTIEVYNLGKLISKRFIPIAKNEFFKKLDDATFADKKFAVIDEFIQSYIETEKPLSLSSHEVGRIIEEFSFDDKLEALRRTHIYVTDRENLSSMIDDKFIHIFDREKARKIVGLE